MQEHEADALLRRALTEPEASVAVALKVGGLPLCGALTVVFHGRRDLATLQTYVAHGRRGAGDAVKGNDLLRVPCDLDLAAAEDRDDAEKLYAEQAATIRDALVSADTVLELWRESLQELIGSSVKLDRRVNIDANLPAHRLLPAALVAPDKGLTVTAVCEARPLADGRPPAGIACAQSDVTRIYPLSGDPEDCIDDFLRAAAERARLSREQLRHQEASVRRFLEISGDE